jgi:hypothetical protein
MLFLKQYYQEIITTLIVAAALWYLVKKLILNKLIKTKSTASKCDNCQ